MYGSFEKEVLKGEHLFITYAHNYLVSDVCKKRELKRTKTRKGVKLERYS